LLFLFGEKIINKRTEENIQERDSQRKSRKEGQG